MQINKLWKHHLNAQSVEATKGYKIRWLYANKFGEIMLNLIS